MVVRRVTLARFSMGNDAARGPAKNRLVEKIGG